MTNSNNSSPKDSSSFKKRLDFMLDTETMGNKNSPILLQISAVITDLSTGEVAEEFDRLINPMSCAFAGLNADGGTVEWWMKQDKEVIKNVFVKSIQEGSDLKEVLLDFTKFVNDIKKKYGQKAVKMWGNGVLADNKWLESAYDACGLELPWKYYENLDVRTLVDLGEFLGVNPKKNIPFKGQKHNAIDDCKWQIEYCSAIFLEMKRLMDQDKKVKELEKKVAELESKVLELQKSAA